MSGPLQVGLVGFGLAGRVFHAPLITAEPELELTAVVTTDAGRAAEVATRYPAAAVLPGLDELLATGPDLVVVAAPTPRHVELARRVIAAGVAVVVDKPFAVHTADGTELIAAAERHRVPFTVFQNRRWDGDFLTVARLVRDGGLGAVRRFESRFEWISARARPPWKSGTAGVDGGGVAYDLGAHLIDQAIRLFGPVAGFHGELDSWTGGPNDDDAFIALHHVSGIRSHLAMSSLVRQRGFRFRVLGSDAAYTKWGLDPQEAQLAAGIDPSSADFGQEPETAWGLLGRDGETRRVPTAPGGYREFYRGVARALRAGDRLPVDPRESLEAIRIIEALHARAAR